MYPDPPLYNLAQNFSNNKGPKYTFGKQKKSTEYSKSFAPGPGAYEIKSRTGSKGRKISFNPSTRYSKLLDKIVHSFAMKNKELMNRADSRTCKTSRSNPHRTDLAKEDYVRLRSSSRLNEIYGKMDDIPGPGAYNPNKVSIHHGVKILTEARVVKAFTIDDDTPGPGSYPSISALNGPKYRFGRERKCVQRLDKTAPGPGAYKIPCTFANPDHYKLPNKQLPFSFV